jgi:predicted PurR-regulated permease PerM
MSEWSPKATKKALWGIFGLVVGGILLYWLLHDREQVSGILSTLKGIFSPFIIGAVLAFILNVPMRAIESKLGKIKKPVLRRLVAVILATIAVLLVIALVFVLLIPQLADTVANLVPKLQNFFLNMEDNIDKLLENNPDLMNWVYANTDLENFDWGSLAETAVTAVGNSVSSLLSGAISALGSIFSALVNFVISIVFAYYCLFQKENLARQGRKLLYAFLPERVADHAVRIMRLSNSTFSNFLSGQCLEVCILGCLFAIAMAIFGMPYIPLVSVLIAITAFIPVVGAWIGCVFGAFFIMVEDPMLAVWFVIMFIIIQQIENNVIYPRVVGTSIGLSGMWVLLAVSMGGALMGVIGMFLMIPIVSVLYTLTREITNKRLSHKHIDSHKLMHQLPELRSRLKWRKPKQ